MNALPLVALGRLTIKIGLAMLTPLHAPTSLDWGGVGWPHASGRYRHLRRPGCHSPFDGSHPSPERIQGTHLVSQSPTLKWVAGGVWDEFQKRMPLLWAWSGSIHGMHFLAAQWVASISFWRVHDGLAVLDALLCWGFGLYAVVARRPAHRLWVGNTSFGIERNGGQPASLRFQLNSLDWEPFFSIGSIGLTD